MFTTAVYIADIEVSLKPRSRKSRLHPITIRHRMYPMTLNKSDQKIPDDKYMFQVKQIVKPHINMENFDKYITEVKINNVKFSTKHYGDR